MIIYQILKYLIITILIIKSYYYLLTIYQQEHYDSNKLIKNTNSYYKKTYMYFNYIIIITSLFTKWYLHLLILFFGTLSLFIKNNFIIKLKTTSRIKRLIITNILIITILIILIYIFIPKILLFTYSLITILAPFILIISNVLNKPIEKAISKYYLKKAKIKLNNNKTIIKIALTGSFGKTSTKNILNRILSENYYTLATPKSYNTLQGISKTINDSLDNNTEIFICEMGAFRKNEIKEMTKYINPHISIITEIGPQHLDTFNNIENIIDTKFEIIDNANKNTIGILNYDNEYIKERKITSIQNIYTVGITNKKTLFYANNINIKNKNNQIITTFDIINTITNETLHIDTVLLGYHNIYNILIAYATIQALKKYQINIANETFIETIYNMESIPHRLSKTQLDNIYIFDDSYNSNIKGFINAIEIIYRMNTKKIIITPGIVDLKDKTLEYNELIATKLLNFDEIYLIDNYSSRYIKKKLEELNYLNIYTYNTYQQAYNEVLKKYHQKDFEVSLLIENDLPDNYLERKKNVKRKIKNRYNIRR